MNLDQITIEIRPRSAWEAVDLGVLMARRWWSPMMKIWFIVSLPFFLLSLLFPQEKLVWAAVFIWWFKPLYERPLLYFLSHAVFNEMPDLRSTLKNCISLFFKQFFLSLTWRRFSFSRSMDLPVLQLEGLTGGRRQERLMVLHREDSAPSGWLHILGFLLEIFVAMGVMSVAWVLVPNEINIDWANVFWDRNSNLADYLLHLTAYVAMWLMAPFYVACGFSLYLNRRIKLEAWDLDIAFRRIVSKRQLSQLLSIFFVVFCFGCVDSQSPVYAQDEPVYQTAAEESAVDSEILGEPTHLHRESSKKSIEDLMQQDEFSHKETVKRLRLKDQDEDESTFIRWLIEWLDRSDVESLGLGSMFELLLWVAFFVLVIIFVYRYRHWLSAQFVRVGSAPPAKEKPVTLFGMDVRRESLPDDVNAAAKALLQAGDHRAALALLYRASLAHLIYSGIEIEDGFTELECLKIMKFDLPKLARTKEDAEYAESRIEYFSLLTSVWRRLAYGHLLPDERELLQLCSSWNQCWLKEMGAKA
ncbi:MAG: hypothetical protein IPK77_16735 [Cellvibrio sp.]|nr:hypothetical protein [Cellvibrio sp.]